MVGYIIVNQTIGHNQYKIDRFKEEFSKKGISLNVLINDGTLAKIENNKVVINFPKCDFVLYLDKDIYLARLLEKEGYRLFNNADFIKMCDDKMLTFVRCANEDINMIKTIAGPLVYVDKLEDKHYDFLNKIVEELCFPMVVKKVYGSLGEGVYLVNNLKELKRLYSEIYRFPILFQEYMESSKGKSVRVLVIDKKVVGAFERFNDSDFRSNFSNTASSRKLDNKSKFVQIAKKIAQKLDILYAGLDFLYDKNGDPILCEINSNAFFEEFEKVTQINVVELYRDMIIKRVQDEQK